jgi:hypothetical protein
MIVRALAKVGIARFIKNPVGNSPAGFLFALLARAGWGELLPSLLSCWWFGFAILLCRR